MQLLTTITTNRIIQAFSWMLIHSLWQGLLLAIVTALVLMATRKASAALRYNLVFVQFLLFVIACTATFAWVWNTGNVQSIPQVFAGTLAANATQAFNIDAGSIRAFGFACANYFTVNAPFVVLVWCILFIMRSVKFMGGLVFIQRARHRKVSLPNAYWQQRIAVLCEKLQLKRAVQLLESGYVKVPFVVGHLKPVILMPIGLLAGLPPEQVEAVLLHELAHIRRNDYVVNFLQTIAETIFFFNPGLMWISSLLRDERENCCDDIALAQTKNKREFVQALISFKEYSLYGAGYQVAFPGKKNHLLQRVSRILQNQNKALGRAEKAFFMAGIVILSAMVATAAIAQIRIITRGENKVSVVAGQPAAQPAKIESKSAHAVKPVVVVKRNKPVPTPAVHEPQELMPTTTSAQEKADLDKVLKEKYASELAKTEADRTRQVADWARFNSSTPPEAALKQKQQTENDMLQAKRDKEQAERDMRQAALDQIQAAKDEIQAKRDQEQAARDQQQAFKDQQQAKKDQLRVQQNSQQHSSNASIQL
jgi:bla regulator protein BlaR1